jgi:hypothetical protein
VDDTTDTAEIIDLTRESSAPPPPAPTKKTITRLTDAQVSAHYRAIMDAFAHASLDVDADGIPKDSGNAAARKLAMQVRRSYAVAHALTVDQVRAVLRRGSFLLQLAAHASAAVASATTGAPTMAAHRARLASEGTTSASPGSRAPADVAPPSQGSIGAPTRDPLLSRLARQFPRDTPMNIAPAIREAMQLAQPQPSDGPTTAPETPASKADPFHSLDGWNEAMTAASQHINDGLDHMKAAIAKEEASHVAPTRIRAAAANVRRYIGAARAAVDLAQRIAEPAAGQLGILHFVLDEADAVAAFVVSL